MATDNGGVAALDYAPGGAIAEVVGNMVPAFLSQQLPGVVFSVHVVDDTLHDTIL